MHTTPCKVGRVSTEETISCRKSGNVYLNNTNVVTLASNHILVLVLGITTLLLVLDLDLVNFQIQKVGVHCLFDSLVDFVALYEIR